MDYNKHQHLRTIELKVVASTRTRSTTETRGEERYGLSFILSPLRWLRSDAMTKGLRGLTFVQRLRVLSSHAVEVMVGV